ncbi:MAG: hypothetical protein ABIA75_05735 [Candidatus Neomarinimicrobiota bacterium]
MNTIPDLKKLEQQTFQSKFSDGLLEITLGLMFLVFSQITWLTDLGWGDFWSSLIILPAYLLVLGTYWWVKKKVVSPRTGYYRYGEKRKQTLMRFNIIILGLLTASLLLGIFSLVKFTPGDWGPALGFPLIILAGFCLAGYFLKIYRLISYGLLIAGAFVFGEILFRNRLALHHGVPLAVGTVALIIIIAGLLRLGRFLRDNRPEPSHDG